MNELTKAGDVLGGMVDRVRGEYVESPGLAVTKAQAQRLWGLDADACARVLGTLVDRGFLRQTASGLYVRAGVR